MAQKWISPIKKKEDYLLRLPSFKDVRVLLDNNDITGSDDSSNTWGIEKFNGLDNLSLRAKPIYKLFRKLRQQSQANIWSSKTTPVSKDFRDFLLMPLSANNMAKIKKSQQFEEDSSSGNKNNESISSTNKGLNWHKPQKRKCEETNEDHRQKKTSKTTTVAHVDRKKQAHLLSSEDSELSDSNSSGPSNVTSTCELDNSRVSGQVFESTSHRPSSSRLQYENLNSEVGSVNNGTDDDSDVSSVNKEDSEIGQSDRQVSREFSRNNKTFQRTEIDSKNQGSTSLEEVCREHIFTQKDEEEISKFSFLLDEDLVKNNHVWILQCPSTMDCSGLVGQKLDLSGNCMLGDGQRSYEAFSYRSHDSRVATLAVPSQRNQLQLMRLPIAGNIIVEESVDITSDSSYSMREAPERVELPDNLCTRHPLFGKNFKKQLKMAKKVDEISIKKEFFGSTNDLNEVSETLERHNSSPKKKKKKRKRETDEFSNLTVSESYLNSSFKSPKKKKIKQEY